MKTRRRARRVTLETLYEYDIANHDPDEVLEQRLEASPMERAGVEFADAMPYPRCDPRSAGNVVHANEQGVVTGGECEMHLVAGVDQ